MNKNNPYLLGYDIGGTKLEAVLFRFGVSSDAELKLQNDEGELIGIDILARSRLATERQKGYRQIISKLATLCRRVCQEAKIEVGAFKGIGMALPGSVHPESQRMLRGNTMVLVDEDICADLKGELGIDLPIRCENDANCFALAEALCGAGIEHFGATGKAVADQVGIGVILGTGCGSGIIIEGKILSGRVGGAGEIGHTILHCNGHPCYCGRNGCAEQYLSGPGIEAAFAQRRYSQVEGFPDARHIFELATALDPIAMAVVKKYQRDLGKFLGSFTTVFDPDYFVLGGGLSLQSAIYENLTKSISENCFLSQDDVSVYRNNLGDSAGVIGAALLVSDKKNR